MINGGASERPVCPADDQRTRDVLSDGMIFSPRALRVMGPSQGQRSVTALLLGRLLPDAIITFVILYRSQSKPIDAAVLITPPTVHAIPP